MKKIAILAGVGLLAAAGVTLFLVSGAKRAAAEESAPPALPPKESFHLFLLVGQSNMAGRGDVAAEDQVAHPRVLVLRKDGTWGPAVDPLHFDKPGAGVGPGRTFGIAVAEARPGITIGLIPAAAGGSPIRTWVPGGYWEQTKSHPYDDAILRAKKAMEAGTLKGILWHQGEGDSGPGAADVYQARLTELIARLRKDLSAPDVPFLIGQLGRFEAAPWSTSKEKVDQAQRAVARDVKNAHFVSAEGLTSKPDNLHFDATGARELGRRYAEAYLKIMVR